MKTKNLYIASSVLGISAVIAISMVGYKLYNRQISLENELLKLHGKVTSSSEPINECVLSSQDERAVEKLVKEITDPWSDLQAKLKDTVVQVYSLIAEFNWLEPYKTPNQGKATGTGFFIDENGYLITNAHVVNQAKAIFIQIPSLGKDQFEVEIVAFNPDRDMALIKLKKSELERLHHFIPKISYLKLGNSDTVKRGAEVLALGFPLGQEGLKSTTGIVSGRESVGGRQFIQIDAPINPGNSGGPCINGRGEVIGINTAKIMDAENVGYIIPINELKLILNEMYNAKEKLMRRPFLGVFYNSSSVAMAEFLNNPIPGGVYVTDVFQGGLLEKAGIKPADMIYEINGYKIDMYGDIILPDSEDRVTLTDYISFLPLGKNVKLTVYRKGKKIVISTKYEMSVLPPVRIKYPDYEKIDYEIIGGMVVLEFARNLLPLLLQQSPDLITYENAKNQLESFLIVTNVFLNSQISRTRVIKAGTRIAEVNGKEVKTLDDFRDALYNSLDSGFFTIKTMQDVFAVCELNKIVAEEGQLASTYRYPITIYMQNLMKKYIEKYEKKTGPVTARNVA